jgi:hypothetical protein
METVLKDEELIEICKFTKNTFGKYVYPIGDLLVREAAFVAMLIAAISTAAPITCCSNMVSALKVLCPLE